MKGDKLSSRIRILSGVLAAVILAAFIAYLAVEWKNIPDTVATHFGASGAADAWGSKSSMLLVPVLAVIICALLTLMEFFPQNWNFPVRVTDENRARLVRDGLLLTGILKVLIAAVFSYIGLCIVRSMPISWPMYVMLGVGAAALVAAVVKMIRDR